MHESFWDFSVSDVRSCDVYKAETDWAWLELTLILFYLIYLGINHQIKMDFSDVVKLKLVIVKPGTKTGH